MRSFRQDAIQRAREILELNPIFLDTETTGLGETAQIIEICIIDTGINYSHPDLGDCNTNEFLEGDCSRLIVGYDFCADDDDCTTNDTDPMDVNGHGTMVSGIAAANG